MTSVFHENGTCTWVSCAFCTLTGKRFSRVQSLGSFLTGAAKPYKRIYCPQRFLVSTVHASAGKKSFPLKVAVSDVGDIVLKKQPTFTAYDIETQAHYFDRTDLKLSVFPTFFQSCLTIIVTNLRTRYGAKPTDVEQDFMRNSGKVARRCKNVL